MPDDPLLMEAQSAIGVHDKKKAREILRRLIKADPRNLSYWLWLSVSVDTPKEITYCLQEALKIDPQNEIAKKGLIFYGVIKPDPITGTDLLSIKNDWQKEFLRKTAPPPPENKAKPPRRGISGFVWVGAGLIVIVAASLLSGFPWKLIRPAQQAIIVNRPTPKASATYLPTKTPFGYVEFPTATNAGPAPLWTLLKATYTPTARYVSTPHSTEAYLLAMRAFDRGDLMTFRKYMDQAIAAEPDNPDFYYYLAAADRLENNNSAALGEYEKALNVDPEFAPGFLGRAQMKEILTPEANYINDIDRAIEHDPRYSEAYLERARYYVRTHQLSKAMSDLEMVLRIDPQTPEAYALQSEIYLAMDKPEEALTAAQTAYDMDVTLLQAYLALGSAYIANGQPEKSIEYLTTYKSFAPLDARAYESLGVAYWFSGDVDLTIEMMSKSINFDRFRFTPFLIRGLAYFQKGDFTGAADDLTKAVDINDNSFIAVFTRAQVYLKLDRNTDAYNQFLRAEGLLEDESMQAEVINWQALAAIAMGDRSSAIKAYKRLLALPAGTVNKAWMDEANSYLNPCKGSKCPTFTPSPTLTPTTCRVSACLTVTPTLTTTPGTQTPGSTTSTPTQTGTPSAE